MSLSQRENLAPPSRNGASDGETTQVVVESPPVTPRSLTFAEPPANPFATPQSFYTPDQTPSANLDSYPFPDATHSVSTSISTSVSTSFADLQSPNVISTSRPGSRSNDGLYIHPTSRPNSSTRPSSARSREAFASPRTRPMTLYSTVQPSITKIQRERPKSTMLDPTSTLHKPWLTSRDPYHKIAYFITYGVMFLGIAAGAVRCYFGWKSVPLLSGNLCMVLEENFDSDVGLFGENGTFFREVDMSGFGHVFYVSSVFL